MPVLRVRPRRDGQRLRPTSAVLFYCRECRQPFEASSPSDRRTGSRSRPSAVDGGSRITRATKGWRVRRRRLGSTGGRRTVPLDLARRAVSTSPSRSLDAAIAIADSTSPARYARSMTDRPARGEAPARERRSRARRDRRGRRRWGPGSPSSRSRPATRSSSHDVDTPPSSAARTGSATGSAARGAARARPGLDRRLGRRPDPRPARHRRARAARPTKPT